MKDITKYKAVSTINLILVGGIGTATIFEIVKGSYWTAIIWAFLVLINALSYRTNLEHYTNEVEADAYLTGFKRGLKRGSRQ